MIIGYLLIETNFIDKIRKVETIAWTTLIFGILLYFSDKFKLYRTIEKDLSYQFIIFIGCLQIFSLIPGVVDLELQ